MIELLAELIHGILAKGECVALFTISVILIVVMHAQNTRKLDNLRHRLTQHEKETRENED